MTEGLRSWILGILAAALLLGVLEALVPSGPVRPVCRMAAGLALFLAVVNPLLQGLPADLSARFSQEVQEFSAYSDTLSQTDESYLETIMSQQAAEYIVSQAQSLGVQVTAQVSCAWQDGLPIPARAVICGALNELQQESLTQWVGDQLGLAPEAIVFEEESP